ncbi:sulfate adenylyltransferase subunit 1 [Crocinitomix algicola]|uniref:sulfate adenylyltransferase subunit 1 n=1 Tax=Crocinitomix algicola TaxID=1740263 RepID=UPI0008379DA3|nr:GTP-binding protein [Crocinitomix algicola]
MKDLNILRLSTAGSVDDGKSTFIGRLLFDTNSLPKDKIESIENASKKRGLDELDLSLITDGLTAEREQGITIDVAHIYFSSKTCKYIIADTPGHVEYTRNMITGASNSQVFMILIDARNGIVEQTKRHLFIASLMEIDQILFVVNKMDLVDYDQGVFNKIKSELTELQNQFNLNNRQLAYFPISAKYGDNVVQKSNNTTWYNGPTVIDYLEQIVLKTPVNEPFRFNVQYVIRPHSDEFHDFRGYAGKVVSGRINLGDKILVQSTGQTAIVKTIHRYKDQLLKAEKGEAITIELDSDIDVSRGDVFSHQESRIGGEKVFQSHICWLSTTDLNLSQKYILKQGSFTTQIKFNQIESQLNFDALAFEQNPENVGVNSINIVEIKSAQPVFLDSYKANPKQGAFIIIDPNSNGTVAVGFKS